jgi:hypothetical protein
MNEIRRLYLTPCPATAATNNETERALTNPETNKTIISGSVPMLIHVECGMVCGGGDFSVSAILVAGTICASVYASRPSHKSSIHPEHRPRRLPLLCLTTFCYRHCAFQCLSCQGISLLYSALLILLLGRYRHAIHHGQGSASCWSSPQQVLICSEIYYCTQKSQPYDFQWPTLGQQGVCSSVVHVVNTTFTSRPPR